MGRSRTNLPKLATRGRSWAKLPKLATRGRSHAKLPKSATMGRSLTNLPKLATRGRSVNPGQCGTTWCLCATWQQSLELRGTTGHDGR